MKPTQVLRRGALVAATVLIGAGQAIAVPVLWGANGHLYEVRLFANQTWDAARADAQSLGAGWDLATITSAAEQAFIASLLGPPPVGGVVEYWIGGFQPASSSEPGADWQWINGEGVFWNSGAVPGVYSNWGPGEPNNGGTGEDHLALDNRYGWGWNDNDPFINGFIFGYVAELPNAVPEPSALALLGVALAGFGAWRRRNR